MASIRSQAIVSLGCGGPKVLPLRVRGVQNMCAGWRLHRMGSTC